MSFENFSAHRVESELEREPFSIPTMDVLEQEVKAQYGSLPYTEQEQKMLDIVRRTREKERVNLLELPKGTIVYCIADGTVRLEVIDAEGHTSPSVIAGEIMDGDYSDADNERVIKVAGVISVGGEKGVHTVEKKLIVIKPEKELTNNE